MKRRNQAKGRTKGGSVRDQGGMSGRKKKGEEGE